MTKKRTKKRRHHASYPLYRLWIRDRGVCWLCGQPVPLAEATRDHKVPKSRGGSNAFFNLALAHRACNQLRGNDLAGPMGGSLGGPTLSTDERIRLQKMDEA